MRKSWAYQRRNIISNIFVVLSPVIIAILLGVLQRLVEKELDKDEENTCGCQCIRCELDDYTISTDLEECNSPHSGECLGKNKAICGLEYSDSSQVEFCAITSPGRFPPMYDSARAQWIPQNYDYDYSDGPSPGPLAFSAAGKAASADDGPLTPAAAPGPADSPESSASGGPTYDFRMLYTGMDVAFTDAMMQRLLRQPDIVACVSGAREAGLQQTDAAFDWPLLGEGLDTSFLSAADWDLASGVEESLFLSALVQSGPNFVSPDCDGFRALRDAAAAGGADGGGR
eukprot:jgi/Ulvmu1/9361/UM050_0113.1